MQNMVVAAPLLNGTLHFDMDAIADTSLVRVTIYIPGGNTLTSSRVLTVTCPRAMLETCALGELRSRFSDLREVSFRVTPVHPGGDMACSGSPRKQRNNDLDLSRCSAAIRCSGGPSVAPPPLLWGIYLLEENI